MRSPPLRLRRRAHDVARPQTAPFRDRPSEGIFNVSVEVGAMASSQAELGRPSEATVELTRLLERVLKQTGAPCSPRALSSSAA